MISSFHCGPRLRIVAPVLRAPSLRSSFLSRTRIAALTMGLALSGAAALAQVSLTTAQPLKEVVVTATRSAGLVSNTVADVSVLDRADLDRSEGQSLMEVLAREPGVQFSGSGGLGTTGSLFIRGHDTRHTVLLIDGVRVGSATTGTPSIDNLPLDAIERIEIVRGPLSSLYGSEAVGGVVQLFTRRGGQGLRPNARVTIGSNRFGQLGAGVSFGEGRFDGAIQVQALDTRGFSAANPREQWGSFDPDRDGFRQNGASVRLGGRLAEGWRIDGMLLESDALARYDDGPGVDSRAKLRTAVQSLQVSGRPGDAWGTRMIVAHSLERYDSLATANPWYTLGAIESSQMQYSWENTFETALGTALALIERLDQDVGRPGQPFTVSERTIDAVALGLSGAASGHSWQASVRNDRNSQFGSQTTGSLGWGYAFTPAWSAGASWGTSFVAPSFNQLYYPGWGNPNLQPEEGEQAELSLRWKSGAHAVRGAWFDSRIRGFITGGPAPVNVPRARIDGLALAYEGRRGNLALGTSMDLIDPRNETTGASFGKVLQRRAKRALKAHVDWHEGPWSLGATWSAYSDRFDDAANTVSLPGYGTIDLRANWRLSRDWTVGARLNNAGGKAYETALGYNQPGRELYLTARYAPH